MEITFKKQANTEEELLNILNPTVKKWFFSKFKSFSEPQLFGVMEVHSRSNTLISAPTGATKTLTSFLSILNELVDSAEKGILENKVYCVYVSPLKALNNDISKNLIEPLKEIEEIAGKKFGIRIAVRTGDTTASEKAKMLKQQPHILITTPESLAILLSSAKFKELLKNVDWCIVDEIHALAENKRGVHLSLSLERLQSLSSYMCRIGLSATVSPIEEIAKFLVGQDYVNKRQCKIIDVQYSKKIDFKVLCPMQNMIDTTYEEMNNELYNLMDKMIQEHKTTLIFTNTRAATERVVHHMKERFPKNYVEYTESLLKNQEREIEQEEKIKGIGAHHGSLSKSHRLQIEEGLRQGKLKAVVCSTSLELGIDIGFIDLVICLGSPKSVARFLQRAGRAGHKLHETIKARLIVLDRDDLVECSVLMKSAIEKKIDRVHIPDNCLDVLAQQIFGIAIADKININELYNMVTKSYCYRNLKREDFNEIIDYLAGKFVSLEDRYIFAKIWYDPETKMIGRKGKMSRVIYMTNIGTIPDETSVLVKAGEQVIGKIDEAFLERLKKGDVFVLGGNTYRFNYASGMVANVNAASGKPTVPSWFSEMLPLSFDLGMEIQKFRRLMEDQFTAGKTKNEIINFINTYLYVDDNAANSIYEYFHEQYLYCQIPTDKKILVEHYNEEDKNYVVFHTLFGRRVNDVLSRAVGFVIGRTYHKDVEIGINDNGFYISHEKDIDAGKAFSILKSSELRNISEIAIDKTEILKRRFRNCAVRALMILRNYKGKTKRIGRQQVSSMILISAVKRISNDFSILKEARREVLEDLMDIENAEKIVKMFEDKKIKIEEVRTNVPSPFAMNLVLQGYIDFLRIEDKLEFIKRMHNMVLAKIALKGKKSEASEKKEEKFDYQQFWKDVEKEKRKKKHDELTDLKLIAWNLKRVPVYAKEEIIKIIEGEKNIRDDIVLELKKHKSHIEKDWPKELADIVLRFIEKY